MGVYSPAQALGLCNKTCQSGQWCAASCGRSPPSWGWTPAESACWWCGRPCPLLLATCKKKKKNSPRCSSVLAKHWQISQLSALLLITSLEYSPRVPQFSILDQVLVWEESYLIAFCFLSEHYDQATKIVDIIELLRKMNRVPFYLPDGYCPIYELFNKAN